MFFEVAIFIIGSFFLGWSAYSDIRTRTASNWIWLLFFISVLILLFARSFQFGFDDLSIVFSIGFIILFYVLFQLHVIPGGADVKALMCLALLIPFFVLDVVLFACVFSGVVWGVVWLFDRDAIKSFPFLLSLFVSFVFVFVLSGFWSFGFLELMFGV